MPESALNSKPGSIDQVIDVNDQTDGIKPKANGGKASRGSTRKSKGDASEEILNQDSMVADIGLSG
jgi:hypothetical protein